MPDLVAAVAEPNRRRLLQLLGAGEQTVSQLARHFTVSRSAISQHLGVLADSGLVTSRRAGKFQYYRVNADRLTVKWRASWLTDCSPAPSSCSRRRRLGSATAATKSGTSTR